MKFALEDLSQKSELPLFPIIKIYLPACLFILTVNFLANKFNISMYDLTADPAEIAGKPPYIGLFSQLGMLLWSGAACISIFTAFLTQVHPSTGRRWFIFLIASFFLTASLLLDDMFQFHEYYYTPILFALEKVPLTGKTIHNLLELLYMFILYVGGFGLYLFYFRNYFRHTEYLYLILAIFFLALSVVVDMAPETLRAHILIEESAKFLGVLSWLAYFYRTCSSIMRQLIAK